MTALICMCYKAHQPGSSHHQTHECWGPAHCYSGQGCQSHTACKVHVGGVDPVLHVLRPDPAPRTRDKVKVKRSEDTTKNTFKQMLVVKAVTHTAFSMAPISLDMPSP